MDLYTMEYVLSVAECKNFSLAAQNCHIGQSALSQQIAKLEKELGVPLFIRNAHGVVLTEPGELFVQKAREILQLSRVLKEEMNGYRELKSGSLNLGIITSLECIDFGHMLSAFCENYPAISVNIITEGTHRLTDRLINRSIDIAFLNHPVSGINPMLNFLALGSDRYSLAVRDDHPLAAFSKVSMKELSNERFIFHQPGQVASELCYNACRNAGFEPQIACRSSNPSTSIFMVQGGLGIALLPSEEFRFLAIPGIKEIKITEPIIKTVGAAWRKDSVSPIVRTMVQFAEEWNSGRKKSNE